MLVFGWIGGAINCIHVLPQMVKIYKTKSGELPVTKVEIVSNIADSLGLEVENLFGLEKTPKATLKTLEDAIGGLD